MILDTSQKYLFHTLLLFPVKNMIRMIIIYIYNPFTCLPINSAENCLYCMSKLTNSLNAGSCDLVLKPLH